MLPTLIVLGAMGLLVLMIACANIAGLVLVRGVSRRGEIALRLALGATRTRIVRLLIVENLVLALPGAVLGVAARVARRSRCWSSYAEALAAPERVFFNIDVDRLVIGFAVLVACGSALVFGFVPALQSSRRRSGVGHQRRRVAARRVREDGCAPGLVVAQVAVSLLLLVGAGLVTRSLEAARRAYPGFDAQPRDLGRGGRQAERVRRGARPRRSIASLLDAAACRRRASSRPRSRPSSRWRFSTRPRRRVAIEGYEPRRDEDLAFLSNTVGPDYFRTLRIDLMAGREFEDRDDESAAPVAIVNNTLAQTILGRRGERDRQAGPRRRGRLADGDRRGRGCEVLCRSTNRRARMSTCHSCSRTGRA